MPFSYIEPIRQKNRADILKDEKCVPLSQVDCNPRSYPQLWHFLQQVEWSSHCLKVPFVNRLEISGSSWADMRIGIFVYHQFQEEIQVMHWVFTMLMHGNIVDSDGDEGVVILRV